MASEPPEFEFEISVRKLAAVPLLLYGSLAALAVGLTVAIPTLWDDRSWRQGLVFFGSLVVLSVGGWYGMLALWGGKYRVVVQAGQLRVESPSRWELGPSFIVDLDRIDHLKFVHNADGPDEYQVITADATYSVDCICGASLFDALRRLRPELTSC